MAALHQRFSCYCEMTPLTEIPILNTSFPHVRYYLVVIVISYRSTALAKFIPEIWQHVAAMQSKGPRNIRVLDTRVSECESDKTDMSC